jgi:hypothetical protein
MRIKKLGNEKDRMLSDYPNNDLSIKRKGMDLVEGGEYEY